jgi:predicted DNA-binding ribbon-helix-helix protein
MAGDRLVKRSLTIAGHATSLRLEPVFWEALARAAGEERMALSTLIARIDAQRVEAGDTVNLASAIRVWLFRRATGG